MSAITGKCIPLVLSLQSIMAFPKCKKLASPSGPLCPVGVPLHMGWQRSWQTSFALWLVSLHTTLKTPNKHFVQHIQNVKLEPGGVMTLYDVKALFTSVPVDPSINIVEHKLLQDPTLPQRTNMSIQQLSYYWSSTSKTHTSSSKVSIMNRSMVLPWVPTSSPSLPTCLWKSLKSRH